MNSVSCGKTGNVSGLFQLAVSSPLSYLAAFWLPCLDAILPLLPSETVVIGLGVATAGSTDPRIGLLVLLAACGAFAGDNLAYVIGRRFGPFADRRFFSGERGRRSRAWAERMLARYGGRLILVCRFIPGGRTAVTLTCGLVGYRRRSFVLATACSAVIWASYAFWLGRLGGKAFESRPWVGFVLAFAIAIGATALIEAVRRIYGRRQGRRPRSGEDSDTAHEELHASAMAAAPAGHPGDMTLGSRLATPGRAELTVDDLMVIAVWALFAVVAIVAAIVLLRTHRYRPLGSRRARQAPFAAGRFAGPAAVSARCTRRR
jgi:membrane-associated protein